MREPIRRRRRRLLRTGATVLAMLVVAVALSSLESAVPGDSAVASERAAAAGTQEVLYTEDFENRPAGSVQLITDYTGVGGRRYTADPLWSNLDACNGFILDGSSPFERSLCARLGKGAAVFDDLKRLVLTLGEHLHPENPTAAQANAAVAAMTEDSTGSDKVMLRTKNLLDFGRAGRFVTFTVDVAAMNCNQKAPLLSFSLVPDVPTAANPAIDVAAVDGCELPYVRDFTVGGKQRSVFFGPLVSDGALLVSGGKYRLVMENQETSGAGNDAAVDNFRLVDGTPKLDKSFGATSVPVNGRVRYTYTITNTPELAAKDGWRFTDVLPTGLKIAPAPNTAVYTCDNAAVTATPGGDTIKVQAGKLRKDQSSCTISVDLTSNTPRGADSSPKQYQTGTANLTELLALKPPTTATVNFYSAPVLGIKKSTTATPNTRIGDTVSYTVVATNTGTGDFTDTNNARFVDDLTRVLDDAELVADSITVKNEAGAVVGAPAVSGGRIVWEGKLEAGKAVTLTYSVNVTGRGDSALRNTAFASKPGATNEQTPNCIPTSQTSNVACTETLLPRLAVTKRADHSPNPLPGEVVTYTVTATNTGLGTFSRGVPAVITDDLTRVLDDASFEGSPTVLPSGGTLNYTAPRLTWSGELGAGKTVVIIYKMKIGNAGDGTVRNVVFPGTGETPACPAAEQTAGRCAVAEYPVLRPGLSWQKVAAAADGTARSDALLEGSEWRLAPVNAQGVETPGQSQRVVDCVAGTAAACTGPDKNPAAGKFLVKPLTLGSYRLTETKAPLGYTLESRGHDVTLTAATLDRDSNLDLGLIANGQKGVPAVPLTGGLGEHVFLLAAGGAALIAAATVAMRIRHRRRGGAHAG